MIKKSRLFTFFDWLDEKLESKRTSFVLLLTLLITAGIVTYFALSEKPSLDKESTWVTFLIYFDLALLFILAVFITKRFVTLWLERRQGKSGSKLHSQFVALFSVTALAPALCLAIFSALFFELNVKSWFSEPVREALKEARAISEVYVQEHKKAIKQDASVLVLELRQHLDALDNNPEEFSKLFNTLAEALRLKEAMIITSDKQVLTRSLLTYSLQFELTPSDMEKASEDKVVLLSNDKGDRVRALIEIATLEGSGAKLYLYVGREIDPLVLQHYQNTAGAIARYAGLEGQKAHVELTFVAFYSLVSLLVLLGCVWVGLQMASSLISPIRKLIVASEEVSQGNLNITIDVTGYQNELDHLTKTFNKMTSQLFNQRVDLMKANKDLDNRRQFIENVISSVSAGVIGVDKEGLIYLNNERALKLLTPKGDIIQEPLNKVAFEFSSVIEHLRASGASSYSDQLPLDRKGQHKILRVTAVKGQDEGVVITFDDVTPLLQAQRKAAWSDVARKIAHEIKNPLTPIQLSAERLKRRFLKFFTQTKDAEVFQNCIDTIIRQVEQIGNLVSEFSSFARLPEPTFRSENLSNLCKQAVLLQRQAYSSVEFLENYERNYDFECDAQQLGQVLTNLLQNSVQALLESNDENPLEKKPKIWVCLQTQDTLLTLTIEDNGPGFPKFNREKLKEPYFTTRSKGTGLGLAIVTKIIEDHNGSIELGDSPHGGAKVTIQFTNNHSY